MLLLSSVGFLAVGGVFSLLLEEPRMEDVKLFYDISDRNQKSNTKKNRLKKVMQYVQK